MHIIHVIIIIITCTLQVLYAAAATLEITLAEVAPPACIVESRSLTMPSTWIERDDVFNTARDLRALLIKSKVSGFLPIKNNTASQVAIHISGLLHAGATSELATVELDVTIDAGETLNTLNFFSYNEIKLGTESHGFLNFYVIENRFKISVEPNRMILFPRPLNPFSFVPDRTSKISSFNETRQQQIKKYRHHVYFFEEFICKDEEILPNVLYLKRQRLYENFKLESIIELPPPATPRIPLNLFSIWLTKLDDPREAPVECVEMAKASSRNNPRTDGWKYYFLVQNPALLPRTTAALEGTDIQLINFSDLLGTLELQDEFDKALAEPNFGKASDILRAEALKKIGGAYLDIDLQVFQSLKPYFYLYDSLFGIEPMTEYIGNAFMASSPNHPIITEIIRLIRRNLTDERRSATNKRGNRKVYSEISPLKELNTILQTGPCVTTIAFHNAAGFGEYRDIAMPPEVFFPGKSLKRPEPLLPALDDPISLTSASLHLWKNTWL